MHGLAPLVGRLKGPFQTPLEAETRQGPRLLSRLRSLTRSDRCRMVAVVVLVVVVVVGVGVGSIIAIRSPHNSRGT